MLIYFFTIFSLYYIFILLMIYGWNAIRVPAKDNGSMSLPFVSVIIAVRNEEKNIHRLLGCLSKQSFPAAKFEVIIVDDDSTDHTTDVLEKFIEEEVFSITVLPNNFKTGHGISPKKAALKKGIRASKGTIIVMTDGDCWFGDDWLKSIIASFENEKTMFVSGPVAFHENKGLLSKIQTLELASLIGSGAAMIQLNYPLMCNGANLAFRKAAFIHVNGYEDFEHQTSGDDVFLMQKIHFSFPRSIQFLKDPKAIVFTFPQPTLSSLINQRRRWASKWNSYLLPFSWLLPIILLTHYFSFFVAIVVLSYGFPTHWEIGIFICIKIILDYILLKKVMFFCNLQLRLGIFLLCEFLYPFYAIFIGISIHFGRYSWKDRIHKTQI